MAPLLKAGGRRLQRTLASSLGVLAHSLVEAGGTRPLNMINICDIVGCNDNHHFADIGLNLSKECGVGEYVFYDRDLFIAMTKYVHQNLRCMYQS